ncbi:hypothetical protein [Mesoflavibacter zeaxanthinifaciens]|uniref:hypothetical protein n=1 Tax=Mesoflavibacter zeaxanthinifaciens TaxID=393060 RepID=UPI000406C038|nr:hypothetical protein [Mesoflavibacter zeaxanthinifaciens]
MTKSKKNAIILGLFIFSSLFVSLFLTIIAFKDIPKYDSPYIFTATVSIIGIFLGYLVLKKVKPIILRFSLKKNDDGTMSALVLMITTGIIFFAFNELNISLSQKTKCDSFYITNKYSEESGFRKPEINTLVVDLINKKETVVCKHELWLSKEIGDRINLCFYESFFGFNYIEINE